MKKLKYIFLIFLACGVSFSCMDDEESLADQIENSSNLAGFSRASMNLSGVADGSEYITELPVIVFGPSAVDLTGDVTMNVSVDPSSTAVEGTHFNLPEKQITLTENGGYSGVIPITMLTEGISTPLAKNPNIILNVESVTASGKVIASGKPLSISMLYLCPSDLAGTYSVTGRYVYSAQGIDQEYSYEDTWMETGDGSYRTTYVGHWSPEALGGEPGMDLVEVCGQITIPSQNLVNLYSNLVEGVSGKSMVVDEETGEIYLEYTICASGNCREYYATYVKQ